MRPPNPPRAFATLLVAATVALATVPAAARAQATTAALVPGGGSLAAWLGLETGRRFTYATADGERVCVEVGAPVTLGERRYAPLVGMPWPELATDSRIFVPLDGTLGLGVIRTPTVRPAGAMDWLLEPVASRVLPAAAVAEPGGLPGDGWFAIGDDPESPEILLYVWCAACMDAGRYVWFERGRGITRIEERTFAGPRRVTLLAAGCD